MSTFPAVANPPKLIFPPEAVTAPRSKLRSPPSKVIFFPAATSKPLPSFATELLVIFPGLEPKPKPIGTSTVKTDSDSGAIALNSPSGNIILSAVLP